MLILFWFAFNDMLQKLGTRAAFVMDPVYIWSFVLVPEKRIAIATIIMGFHLEIFDSSYRNSL